MKKKFKKQVVDVSKVDKVEAPTWEFTKLSENKPDKDQDKKVTESVKTFADILAEEDT